MTESQVYFLRAPSVGLLKIGRSIDIERRLSEIRLISPVKLELLGYVSGDWSVETAYHRRWHGLRQHGEWFTETAELRAALECDIVLNAWNRASAEAREMALEQMDGPVMDNCRAGAD